MIYLQYSNQLRVLMMGIILTLRNARGSMGKFATFFLFAVNAVVDSEIDKSSSLSPDRDTAAVPGNLLISSSVSTA
jgi:hypothetical protein